MNVSEIVLDQKENKKDYSEDLIKLNIVEEKLEKKVALSHSLLTYTSIITGVIIITLLYAALAGFINHTAIMLDAILIIWHIILIARIAVIRRELDIIRRDALKLKNTKRSNT
ncbi:MAG: hypothetical protein ACFFD5_09080 [Candidatus Thorarchaeota archaeon]